jgi:hypothetical protein
MGARNPNNPMLPYGTDKCRCTCGEYFNSTYAFTEHRTGDGEKRGLNRRCLTVEELISKGWVKNKTGHWVTRPYAERALRARSADLKESVGEGGPRE